VSVIHPLDFHAKRLGVDIPLFLRNTQFYSSLLHSYIVSIVRGLSKSGVSNTLPAISFYAALALILFELQNVAHPTADLSLTT
jgi:hypothetical protein